MRAYMESKIRIIVVVIAAIALAVLLMVGYIAISIGGLNFKTAPEINGTISGNISIARNNLLVYNNSQNIVGYALLGYRLSNATAMNVSLAMYSKQPVERVYLADSLIGAVDYCIQCFQTSSLEDALQASLRQHGLIENATSFNLVSLENLSTVPNNSIIVLATGLIPGSLLPGQPFAGIDLTGNETLLGLLARGDSVIYVGTNFSGAIGLQGGRFVTPQSNLALLNYSGIATLPFRAGQTVLNSSMQLNLHFSSPTFRFYRGIEEEGNASWINVENGTLIALSNYPTVGWANASSLANDIATMIDSKFWFNRLTYGYTKYNITNTTAIGTAPVLTLQQQAGYPINGSEALQYQNDYSVAQIFISNDRYQVETQIPFRSEFLSDGLVSMQPVVGETQIVPVTISSSNTLNQQTSFHLSILNLSGNLFGSLPVGFFSKPFSVQQYSHFSLPSGYYIAELQDISSTPYTATLFQVANVTFSPVALNFKNNTFIFNVSSNRIPLYNISYTASVNGAYTENGKTTQDGKLIYALPSGAVEQYGQKTFTFGMFGTTYDYRVGYIQPAGISIPPLYIEFGIAIAIVILLNVLLKAPAQDDYFIDVPNFPPARRVKLKTDRNAITGIFDSVNYTYRWKYMPLTAEEVKNGVSSNIRYENVPIAITLQNTTSVLNKLANEGALVASGGYYAPVKWVTESHHDIEYLTIFRKLRDYCVQNAMLFTDLDADPHIDMIITKRGAQAHVIIYSSISGMKDVALNNAYKVYVVFLSEMQKLDFIGRLYNSYGDDAELLKMGIEYSYIILIDTDNLDQFIL